MEYWNYTSQSRSGKITLGTEYRIYSKSIKRNDKKEIRTEEKTSEENIENPVSETREETGKNDETKACTESTITGVPSDSPETTTPHSGEKSSDGVKCESNTEESSTEEKNSESITDGIDSGEK